MKVMEPRVVKIVNPEKSLIYHVDMAQKASYDLSYLVKYMRSASEVKRIEQEKRLAKAFEDQEAARRQAHLQAQNMAIQLHDASTVISLLYRVHKAKKIVQQKRLQNKIEALGKELKSLSKVCIPLQRRYRIYSTVAWLNKRGVKFKVGRKRKKKRYEPVTDKISFDELEVRINYELRQRQINDRKNNFYRLYEKHVKAVLLLDTNIAYWLKQFKKAEEFEAPLVEIREKYFKAHDEQSQITAALKPTMDPKAYEVLETELKVLMIPVDAADARLSNCRNVRQWITQILRSAYRRKAILEERLRDTIKRLEWVALESFLVSRIEFHMTVRRKMLKAFPSMKGAVLWLDRYIRYAAEHLAALDAQQETILLEEINKIDRDYHAALEYDSLMEELHQVSPLHIFCNFLFLEILISFFPPPHRVSFYPLTY